MILLYADAENALGLECCTKFQSVSQVTSCSSFWKKRSGIEK